jgi:hypothetical protein
MYHIYHSLHDDIITATKDTNVDPAYLAALISLESNPPGNKNSNRFESSVQQRLLALRNEKKPFGKIPERAVSDLTDDEIKALSHSYGLVQIMGYHCIDLGCTIDDLTGENQLKWAVTYMQDHYRKQITMKDWESCFRIHNTGQSSGEPPRKDYVERGMMRMKLYSELMKTNGSF